MASSGYNFDKEDKHRKYLYDSKGRIIATKNSKGHYIDNRGHILASKNHIYDPDSDSETERERRDRVVYEGYGREGGRLSTSFPSRRGPSETRERSTTGSLQFANGLPFDKSDVRPQSSMGYSATPTAPRGAGYQPCEEPFRIGSPIKTQYLEYKNACDTVYPATKKRYEEELRNRQVLDRRLAVGGQVLSSTYLDQAGHADVLPYARSANQAGLDGATKRLAHTSDHYGRMSRKGHPGHLQGAAAMATNAGVSTPAHLARLHGHFSQDPKILEDDKPLSQLSASERKMREKRREIEWHRKKTEYEISETEWEKTNTERLAAQAQNRVYNEDWQKKEQESLATPPQRREPSTGEIGMMHESKMANGRYEWIAIGGGRRGIWNERHHCYVPEKSDNYADIRNDEGELFYDARLGRATR